MIPRVPVVSSSCASNSRYTFALTISRILLENDDRFLLPLYPFDRQLARGWGKCVRSVALEITLWPTRQPIWKYHPEETIHQAIAKELNDRTEIDRDTARYRCECFFDYNQTAYCMKFFIVWNLIWILDFIGSPLTGKINVDKLIFLNIKCICEMQPHVFYR